MSLAFPRFDGAVVVEALAPDFAVLLAGLSAHQSASATARHQILLDSGRPSDMGDAKPQIDIFARNGQPAVVPSIGSFSVEVARTLSENSTK